MEFADPLAVGRGPLWPLRQKRAISRKRSTRPRARLPGGGPAAGSRGAEARTPVVTGYDQNMTRAVTAKVRPGSLRGTVASVSMPSELRSANVSSNRLRMSKRTWRF